MPQIWNGHWIWNWCSRYSDRIRLLPVLHHFNHMFTDARLIARIPSWPQQRVNVCNSLFILMLSAGRT
ncbi:unnamed protein product, partial [Nesidiocoris tenuis]